MTNFRLLQIKRLADNNFKFYILNGRKFSLRAISPFPRVLSEDFYCRLVETRVCLGRVNLKALVNDK